MSPRANKLTKGVLMMVGTIIGAGVFALPAMFAYVGFWPGTFLFWGLAGTVTCVHLLLVDISLSFPMKQRLVGYAKDVLGRGGFVIASITYPLSSIGMILAYLILGGEFLDQILSFTGWSGHVLSWQLFFWAGGAIIVLLGLKFVAKIESLATILLIACMTMISFLAVGRIDLHLALTTHWNDLLIPFGVFLFSLSGMKIVSEVVDLTRPRRRDAMWAVGIGTGIAALLSWVFGVSLFLAGGTEIGQWGWLIPTFGFLAIVTSYVAVAQDLKATLHLDFHLDRFMSWVTALGVPLLLLFLTARDFLATINIVGSVFEATNGMLISLIAWFILQKKATTSWWWARAIPFITFLIFLTGFLHELFFRSTL
ncbi:MAG: aromatic amino acid transport family protein [Candidatus Uhrbacteria bacterium]|nr:aromatic amino acid transport family protein [Candidatus Uhrbacteria bacterium]MDP3794291.1 aromatic amino acid transport family protein [Candidatus Uhrbacteria bacterium]